MFVDAQIFKRAGNTSLTTSLKSTLTVPLPRELATADTPSSTFTEALCGASS